MTTAEHTAGAADRPIHGAERRTLALLAIPGLVLALATTVVTTYLPVQLQAGRTSTTVIGLLIATEGVMAIALPLVIGVWSDHLDTRIGGRLPFLVAAVGPMALALVLLGAVGTIGVAALLLLVFFAGYFACYEPYRALYPDLVDDEIAARAQSTQALARGVGTFLALVGGGLLLSLADAAPFVAAAALVVGGIATFVVTVVRRGLPDRAPADGDGVRDAARGVLAMARERPELRAYLVANGLWELSLGALKTFVVLYLTIGLGFRVSEASLIIGGVALLLLVAAAVSGKLADRVGATAVMRVATLVYGVGLLVPFLVTSHAVIALAAPLIAFGGGVVMTLPYAILMPLMNEDEHGALTGFYSASRGLGTALGPLLAGVAISLTSDVFGTTQGYQATWGVCAVAVLLSLVPLARLRRLTVNRRA